MEPDRRAWLMGAAAASALAAPLCVLAQAPAGPPSPEERAQVLKEIAREGYILLLPCLEVLRTRDKAFAQGLPPNRFFHRRTLAGPQNRDVTTPNSDTLYSSAFLDLRKGPVTVSVPASPNRYLSVALMDAWTNNFHIAGTRTDGGKAARLIVATAAQAATLRPGPEARVVVSPTAWVWALGRVLVDGEADLPAARAVQDGIVAEGEAGPPPPKAPGREAGLEALIGQGQAAILDAGALKADIGPIFGLVRRFLVLGIDATSPTAADGVDAATRAAVQAGIDEARARLASGALQPAADGGWTAPKPDIGNFGTDYPYRAAIAVAGLAALPREEALYLWAAGDGAAGSPPRTFDGRRPWRLDLPRLPVDGFWSLTLYEATPEGGYYFAENPLRRYALGDRSPGLVKTADAGVTLWIGAADPGAERRANWLPSPPGPFALVLRAYLPRAEWLDGRFRVPAVRAG